MSRVFSDPDAESEEQRELGFPAAERAANARDDAPEPVEHRRDAGRADRSGEPARRDFFRAQRRPVLPLVGLVGAAATLGFFLWLGRDDPAPPTGPAAEELAPVAAAPDFEMPFPDAGASAPAATPGAGSLAAAPEPDPSIAPAAPLPAPPQASAAAAPEQLAALAEPAPAAATAKPAAAAPRPAVVRNAFSVQLLAARSEADVGASWEKLRGAHPDLLASLSPTVARTERAPGDTFYRLRAGPLPDRSAADALCRSLSARQQSCFVVSPGS